MKLRVPGWGEVVDTLAITGVEFSADNRTAVIRADTSKKDMAVAGIFVNGAFFDGNPVTYPITEGTRYLDLQAKDSEGDLSEIVTRRVPGWSDVLPSILVTSLEIAADRSSAHIEAEDQTGQTEIVGILVNEEYSEGNPVDYTIPAGTTKIEAQAVNEEGDLSEVVVKEVPALPTGGSGDSQTGAPVISIQNPDWVRANKSVRVKITAKGAAKIYARAGKTGDFIDITDAGYYSIRENTTISVKALSPFGIEATAKKDIRCFDNTPPSMRAEQIGDSVEISARDFQSGLASITVNGKKYSGNAISGGILSCPIPKNAKSVTVQAADLVGNVSDPVVLHLKGEKTPLPVQQMPVIQEPEKDDSMSELISQIEKLTGVVRTQQSSIEKLEKRQQELDGLLAGITIASGEDMQLRLGSTQEDSLRVLNAPHSNNRLRIVVLMISAICGIALLVAIILIVQKRREQTAE